MAVSDALASCPHDNDAITNFVKEEYAFSTCIHDSFEDENDAFLTCRYDSSKYACTFNINETQNTWYFDSGASKHITSRKCFFDSLQSSPSAKRVSCANNSSYSVCGIGEIVLTVVDGLDFRFYDVLYVRGIKKNSLSVSSLNKRGFQVVFEDDKCAVRDKECDCALRLFGTLYCGFFMLDIYEKRSHHALV